MSTIPYGSGASGVNTNGSLPAIDPATGKKIIYVCHGRQCGRHAKYIMERLAQLEAKGSM